MGSGAGASCGINMNTSLSMEEQELYQNTDEILSLLRQSRTIAIVGLSSERQKASFFVASYLKYEGYKIVPVNPKYLEILGEKCYPDLESIPFKIDVINIFRPSHDCNEIVKKGIELKAGAVWMQLKIVNKDAAELARDAGLVAVMDKCIKMEHGRYSGTLHHAGMNTGIISSRRRNFSRD